MQNKCHPKCPKCPKCGRSINSKKKNINLLSLIFLFGDVNLKKNKKAKCDLCGQR